MSIKLIKKIINSDDFTDEEKIKLIKSELEEKVSPIWVNTNSPWWGIYPPYFEGPIITSAGTDLLGPHILCSGPDLTCNTTDDDYWLTN